MKVVTANRLQDGAVVYLAPDNSWSERFSGAVLITDAEAQDVISVISGRVREIADVYLIDADASGPIGRETLRETIRSAGPTVRPDLGKQGERA